MALSPHDAARALFESGRLAESERAWREILEGAPGDAEALHMLGYILADTGRADEGLAYLGRSIDAQPRNAAMRSNRASVLQTLGRDEEALRDLRRALDLEPGLAAPQVLLGNIQLKAGRLDEALAAYRRAIAADPNVPDAHVGVALVQLRRGEAANAQAGIDAALRLDPGHPAALYNQAVILDARGDTARAESAYLRALERSPRYWQALNNLGVLLRRTGREPEARECFERALAMAPREADVLNNAGIGLQRDDRLDESIARYSQAVDARPAFPQALVNWGNALQDKGALDAARGRYEAAEQASPGFPEARYGRAQVALRQRRFQEGWAHYEARFETRPPFAQRRALPMLRLDASNLARARRVAVWSEQGLGDQVLFSTLLPELERRGIGAVVEIDPRLAITYRRRFPGMQFTTPAESAQAFRECDFHIPMGSLPGLFRPDAAAFSAQAEALLAADPERVAAARKALGPGPWIGISWRSLQRGEREAVARRKSIPLEEFGALAAIEGVRLLDLQYGEIPDERERFEARHPGRLTRLAGLDTMNDIEGVLAAIAACDRIVTSSNVLAHFAGALGKPTWLVYLAAREPFHYWVPDDAGRSPWYPSVEVVTDPAWTTWEQAFAALAERIDL